MVKSEIVQIITDNLCPYLTADGVRVYPSSGLIKYVVNLRGYLLEISYEFRDNLYRVRIEEMDDNQIGDIFLLTQSKKYHRDLRKLMRQNRLSKKELKSHVICLCEIVRKQLEHCDNLNEFISSYVSDLKFDGIFL